MADVVFLNPPPYLELVDERAALKPWTVGDYGREKAPSARALVVYRDVVDGHLLQKLPKLEAVVRIGVGYDNLDLHELGKRGVLAYNVADYCVSEVAEHALALALAIERGLPTQQRILRAKGWSVLGTGGDALPRRLSRLVCGIVGFGRIGRAVGSRAKTLYGGVAAFDPFVSNDLVEGNGAIPAATLDELLAKADHVYIHATLNETSRNMINEQSLGSCRQGAVIVNCARGAIVDPRSLVSALDRGVLRGAGIDTFSPEIPWDSEETAALVSHKNVLATCHRAFLSEASVASLLARVRGTLEQLLSGRRPRHGRLV